MAITKICDGYYYGTQEDLKPLLLGGAEENAIYCAVDSGAVYKGVYPQLGKSKADGAPCILGIMDIVNRGKSAPNVLVNTRDLDGYFLKRNAHMLVGRKLRVQSILENLLIKNSKWAETDETNGYTRTGSQITFTNEQSAAIVKDLNVYADEVTALAICVVNNGADSVSSGSVKVGYLGSDSSFVEIKSVSSVSAGSYKAYRDVKIEGAEVVPHAHLVLQLTAAVADISVLIADEKYAAPYVNWGLQLLAKYDAISNIMDRGTLDDRTAEIYTFSDPEFIISMSVFKANTAEKFTGIEDNRYSVTAGNARPIVAEEPKEGKPRWFNFVGTANTGGADSKAMVGVFGIAEVLD